MAEMDTSSGGGHKKGPGVKKSKKLSTRVDLTPMVDLGFLLITFFVFTTTMSRSTAMNMTEPKDDPSHVKELKKDGVITLLLGDKDVLCYYEGQLDSTSDQMLTQVKKITDFTGTNIHQLRKVITDKKKKTETKYLMYIIKSSKESTFKNSVSILDEMTICDIPNGHYAESDLTPVEEIILKIKEKEKP